MTFIKSEKDIEKMRRSGTIAASILKELAGMVRPGITTRELNAFAEKRIAEANKEYGDVKSAFLGYQGFSAVLCTSVNSIIVHGMPDDTPLVEGGSIGLDFGVAYKGWYSDTAVTVPIGQIDSETHRILRVCRKALKVGIKKARPGSTTGDIGNTIQRYVEQQGYEIVRDLTGHGVGRALHEDPEIPNFGVRHKGVVLEPGMTIAIEPMITKGSAHVSISGEGISGEYETRDATLNAHFEDTIVITENGNEVLTKPK